MRMGDRFRASCGVPQGDRDPAVRGVSVWRAERAKLRCGAKGWRVAPFRDTVDPTTHLSVMTAAASIQALQEKFPAAFVSAHEFRGEQTVVVRAEHLAAVMGWLKDELAYDLMLDASSVDHMGEEPRFEMVYELYSLASRARLRVKVAVPGEEVASVAGIWPTADWHEREVYDMMGIRFTGHPDLRRILMWAGYPYFPLRKDFPLAGKPTEVPDVAFTGIAPLAGGPFVTAPGAGDRVAGEPRAKGESGKGDRG